MSRIQKILLSTGILAALVITISLAVATIVKPNQATPIKKLIPTTFKPKNTVNIPNSNTFAAWIWQSPTQIKDVDSIIKFSKVEGINTFYLYIDEYIDIYEMPEGEDKTKRIQDFENSIKSIIIGAKANNIKVHALSGNTNYSYDSHSYIPPILINFVYEFNKKFSDAKFDGIQFDVEFYEDSRYFNSPDEYQKSYLKFVADAVNQINNLNTVNQESIRFGLAIPFWLDQSNDYLRKPILADVIALMSTIPNSYLVVMAYRNTIDGKGGVLDISESELEAVNNSPVKIVIGQELANNKDAKITHYGRSKNDIKADLVKIIDGEKSNPSFEGISVHDLNAFMQTL